MALVAAVRRRVRVEMRLEGSKAVRGAGLTGSEGTDAAESVIAAESAPCQVLVMGGVLMGDICCGSGGFCRALASP